MTLNAGGSSDNRTLAGTSRGWGTADTCLPVTLMNSALEANPIVIVEEIDKAGGNDRNGRIAQTLLTMIEPGTSRRYYDEALGVAVDLSRVTWIMTANDRSKIDPLLRTRCKVLMVGPPRPCDFDVLMRGIINDIATEFGGDPEHLPELERPILDALCRGFRNRALTARQLAGLVRKTLSGAVVAERRQTRH